MVRKKGALDLPEIFREVRKRHPATSLEIVGSDAVDRLSGLDSTWEHLQAQFAEEDRSRVHYRGAVPRSEVPRILSEASVCLFPSYAEALPVAWLEAMAAARANRRLRHRLGTRGRPIRRRWTSRGRGAP